jgi:hypothetical protein
MRVLVTGARGLLAPFVIRALWERHAVVLLSRRPLRAEFAAFRTQTLAQAMFSGENLPHKLAGEQPEFSDALLRTIFLYCGPDQSLREVAGTLTLQTEGQHPEDQTQAVVNEAKSRWRPGHVPAVGTDT